jgi:hypothetical protein
MKPQFALPPMFWLLLALASFIAAFTSWQNQRLDRIRPPAVSAPTPELTPLAEPATPPAPAPVTAAAGASAAAGTADGDQAPVRQLEPTAGRQVLRCVSKGRVTYRDLNAGCPEGASERITVFPTEGVGKPK